MSASAMLRHVGTTIQRAAVAALKTARQAARRFLTHETWSRSSLTRTWDTVHRHPRQVALGGVLVAASLALVAHECGGTLPEGVVLAAVREGPFRAVIVEAGTLDALRSVTYASSIQSNQAKIVALAPEGKPVKKGDLLILFDPAPFEEEIRRSEAQLAQGQAELASAQQDLKLQEIQNQEDLTAARRRVEKARLELKDAEKGKGLLKEDESRAAVAQAERELQKAQGSVEDLKPLLAEGFITKQELERAEQQVVKAQEDLELARRRNDTLVEYGRPLELAEASSAAAVSREQARQLESAAASRVEQKKAAIAAAESRIQEAQSRLNLAREQLAHTEVHADVPGIVVYREVFFGSEQRKPQVGDQVWANQPLLILPDISHMVVETRIRETDIHKIERNQNVAIHVDAYPSLKLTGRVTLIGTLAEEEHGRKGPKYFSTTIAISESDPRLRPGMSARVEILVEERAKALFVPLSAVFEADGESICYVLEGHRLRRRAVVLGPSNEDQVVVEKGLRRGDRVCLTDPTLGAGEDSAPRS